MTPSLSQRPMRLTLAALLPLAAGTALVALLRPLGPQVSDLPASQVHAALASLARPPRPLPAVAPWRSEGIALSTLRRYQLQPGLELRLQRVQVWRRADFQLAYITRPWTAGRRDLALGATRRLVHGQAGVHALAQRGATAVRQTCLVGESGAALAGVTAAQLAAPVDQRANRPATIAARLVGLEPNRSWQCLLVSLHSDRRLHAEPQVAGLWSRLQPVLAGL
jgi:hypothetical protein